jgi:mycothiol synthase
MVTDACIIRDYESSDLDRYLRFHAEAESICRCGDEFFLASLKGESPHPITFSEKDFLLAEQREDIVGACRVVPEPVIDRAVLMLLAAPGFRASACTTSLLSAALERAMVLNLTKVHADLKEEDAAARELFSKQGFVPVRQYAEMALDLETAAIVKPEHEGLSFRKLEPGDEDEFTALQNSAFEGSWGFCPNTSEEIVQQLNVPGYGHDGVIIAYQGEHAIGYCWTTEVDRPDGAIGRIHMMGIAPEFQGQGLATYILSSGLNHLASKGIQTVELTMDNENKAACALYEAAGFTTKTALVWYEKETR